MEAPGNCYNINVPDEACFDWLMPTKQEISKIHVYNNESKIKFDGQIERLKAPTIST